MPEHGEHADVVPDLERSIELFDMALREPDGVTVMGWADDAVLHAANRRPRYREQHFYVTPEIERTHEDVVLILAVRVPHPDVMSLDEVLLGPDHALLKAEQSDRDGAS